MRAKSLMRGQFQILGLDRLGYDGSAVHAFEDLQLGKSAKLGNGSGKPHGLVAAWAAGRSFAFLSEREGEGIDVCQSNERTATLQPGVYTCR